MAGCGERECNRGTSPVQRTSPTVVPVPLSPVEVQQEHVVFYLHLFVERYGHGERCEKFVSIFNDWVVAQAVYFGSEGKRAALYSIRQEMTGWLDVTTVTPNSDYGVPP
jgi:hypothetical protein